MVHYNETKMNLKLFKCPTCKAKNDEPCKTPKGKIKNTVHDTRPFGLEIKENKNEY